MYNKNTPQAYIIQLTKSMPWRSEGELNSNITAMSLNYLSKYKRIVYNGNLLKKTFIISSLFIQCSMKVYAKPACDALVQLHVTSRTPSYLSCCKENVHKSRQLLTDMLTNKTLDSQTHKNYLRTNVIQFQSHPLNTKRQLLAIKKGDKTST